MISPEVAVALCRFVHDTATLLLWGAFAYLAILVPRDLGRAVAGRLATFRWLCIVAAVSTVALRLPIETAAIADGWADAVAPATLRAVLFGTSVGDAWRIEATTALLLLACLGVPPHWRSGATAAASGLLLVSLTLSGHAVMHTGGLGAVHRLNQALHVLAGGAWLGALVPLIPILRALDDPAHRGEAGVALRAFSSVGHGAVAMVLATGIADVVLVLERWPTDLSSPYQALLDLKIGLVLAMTGLALVNRYRIVPRLGVERAAGRARLRRNTVAAVALGVGAVATVAVFGLLDPQ